MLRRFRHLYLLWDALDFISPALEQQSLNDYQQ
jgi:hypothetical protein